MKILKTYQQLIPIIAIPLILLSGILVWFFPNIVAQAFQAHWIILLIALGIACGPWGKQRLVVHTDETPRYSLLSWLSRILLLQLCWYAIFFGISMACGQIAPILTIQHPHLLQQTLNQILFKEGLFPWALVALLAVSFGYYSYCRQQNAYLSTTIQAVVVNTPADRIGIVINSCGSFSVLLAYASTFAWLSLLWAGGFTATTLATGFSFATLMLVTILLIASITKFYRKHFMRSLGRDLPIIVGLFVWVIFLAVGIWLFNGFLVNLFPTQIQPPFLIKVWEQKPWLSLWLIFANSWWLAWLPLLSALIARLSRGYRIRELIFALLALPMLGGVLSALIKTPWTLSPILCIFISAVGLLGVFIFTLQKAVLPIFFLNTLPQKDVYKYRSPRLRLFKIMRTAFFLLFMYLPAGMPLITILFLTSALPLSIIFLIAVYALFILILP